jgi:hypothetical protein
MIKQKSLKIIAVLFLALSIVLLSLTVFRFLQFSFVPSGYYKIVSIKPQQSYAVSNAVIQVFIKGSDIDFSKVKYEDGRDIRFYDTSGNSLRFYKVYFSRTQQTGIFYVLLPNLPASSSTLQIYCSYGQEDAIASDSTIFYDCKNYDTSNVLWYGASVSKITGINVYGEKVTFPYTDSNTYTTSRLAINIPSKFTLSFAYSKDSSYTGSDSWSDISFYGKTINSNGELLFTIVVYNDGSVTIDSLTAYKSPSGTILNNNWYIFTVSFNYDYGKAQFYIRRLNGTLVYKTLDIPINKKSTSYTNPTLCLDHRGVYYLTLPGSFSFDETVVYSTYLDREPIITFIAPALEITFLTFSDLTFPSLTDVTLTVRISVSGLVSSSRQVTFQIDAKQDYPGLPIGTTITDNSGIATVTFTTPSSTYSPYTLRITVQDIGEQTFSMKVLKAFKITYSKIPTTCEYNLQGDYDLIIEGSVADKENPNSIVTGFTLTPTVKGPDGKSIETTMLVQSNTFTVKSKVYNAYKDLQERNVTVSLTFSMTGYWTLTEKRYVYMVQPRIQAVLLEPQTTVFSVGANKIRLSFQGSQASTLTQDLVKVVIVTPDGTKIDSSTLQTYWQSGTYPTYSVWYTFDKPGTYHLEITVNITPPQYQDITLYVTEAGFSIPWQYIVIGVIILLILYWLFKR